jgi:hypothetical protein
MAACVLILAADCPIDGRLPLPPAPVPFPKIKKKLNPCGSGMRFRTTLLKEISELNSERNCKIC